ncbi:hypothetical protein DY000_02019000 [Brassica cretica]|uniref:Protein NEOXANTHIN-DEFICIENT 1 n=1 Tax=Brassica cretica TaxID=69181 RepID=A0ABQ7DAT7_BRACR|nr:hypothetical protein DY000_02019000 [Brassica cretica]
MDVLFKNVSSCSSPSCICFAEFSSCFGFSALYQINLVKATTARAFIPKELRLVEAFGYTLGGFFLASYDDSPAGVFDELVVIAGTVWNPPTSCAWAARVLVNSDEACHHGRKEVGLPSQVARFSKKITAVPKGKRERTFGLLDTFRLGTSMSHPEDMVEVKVSEVDGAASADICSIKFRSDEMEKKLGNWMGPAIKMSLPSFSGNTKYFANLLKYSCHLQCRVRPVRPAVVSHPLDNETDSGENIHSSQELHENERRLSVAVMLSKPIIALEFKDLTMQVEAPVVV